MHSQPFAAQTILAHNLYKHTSGREGIERSSVLCVLFTPSSMLYVLTAFTIVVLANNEPGHAPLLVVTSHA